MKNVRLFLWVTRNLEFTGLKKADKEDLYFNYPIIIRRPKSLPKDCESYCALYKCCKNMPLKDRQIIYNKVLFKLSVKQYFMFCALLLWGEIDEKEFNKIDFRTGRCRKPNQKAARNLEKSINILKREIKKKIKAASRAVFDEESYKDDFINNLAVFDSWTRIAICKYRPALSPCYLEKVCKQNI